MIRSTHRSHLRTIAWAAFVAAVLLVPVDDSGVEGGWIDWVLERLPFADKLGHALLFGLMAWFACGSFETLGLRRRGALAALSAAAYGVVLDLLQTLVPGRSADALDMMADTVGALGGAIMAILIRTPRAGAPRQDPPPASSAAEDPLP